MSECFTPVCRVAESVFYRNSTELLPSAGGSAHVKLSYFIFTQSRAGAKLSELKIHPVRYHGNGTLKSFGGLLPLSGRSQMSYYTMHYGLLES